MKRMGFSNKWSFVTVFPFRFLGMGVYLAWIYTVHFGNLPFSPSDNDYTAEMSFIVSNALCATCLILCSVLSDKIAPLFKQKGVLFVAALCMTAGTLASSTVPLLSFDSSVFLIAGSALSGIGLALSILLWAEFYAKLRMQQVAVFYSASFLLAMILHFLILSIASPFDIILAAILPIISIAMLALSQMAVRQSTNTATAVNCIEEDDLELTKSTIKEVNSTCVINAPNSSHISALPAITANTAAGKEAGEPITKWTIPFRPVILMAAYSFAFNYCRTTGGTVSELSMLGVGIIALFVLLISLFLFDKFDVRHLYKTALPFMVAGLLFQAFLQDGDQVLSGIFLNIGHAGFVIFMMIVLANICYRYGVNAIWLFGITRASRVISGVAGSYIGTFIMNAFGHYEQTFALSMIVVILVACSMMCLNDKDLASTWGITPVKSVDRDAVTITNYYETFAGKCAQIARIFGLTHREEEVFALLAQGKSVPMVEKELYISNGTAKTHVRHIYKKLGIHSRDELISLVGMDKPEKFIQEKPGRHE